MKKFYRIQHTNPQIGLWYKPNGEFTGSIHKEYDYCTNSSLEMPFDEELVGYVSVANDLVHLTYWVSFDDIKRLQREGFVVIEITSDDYKFYDIFQHFVVNEKTAIVSKKLFLNDDNVFIELL